MSCGLLMSTWSFLHSLQYAIEQVLVHHSPLQLPLTYLIHSDHDHILFLWLHCEAACLGKDGLDHTGKTVPIAEGIDYYVMLMKQALEPPMILGRAMMLYFMTLSCPCEGARWEGRGWGFSCQGRLQWFWITMSCWDCWWLVKRLKSVLVWSSASLKYTQCTVGWGRVSAPVCSQSCAWANGPKWSKWSMGWKVRSRTVRLDLPWHGGVALKKVFVCLGCVPCKFPTNYGWESLALQGKELPQSLLTALRWDIFISYHRFLLIVLTAYWFSGTTSTVAYSQALR